MSGMERNIARISNLTPDQLNTVNRLMSRDERYADELTRSTGISDSRDSRITGGMIRAALYTMAGSPRVTEVLDMVEEDGS